MAHFFSTRTSFMLGLLGIGNAFILTPISYSSYRPITTLDIRTIINYDESGPRPSSPTINGATYELDLPFVNTPYDNTNPHRLRQSPCLVDDPVIAVESTTTLIHPNTKITPIETQRFAVMPSWITWVNTLLDSTCFVFPENNAISDTALRKPNKAIQNSETLLSQQVNLVDNRFSPTDVAVSSCLLHFPIFYREIQFNQWPNGMAKDMLRYTSRKFDENADSRNVQNFFVAPRKNTPQQIPKQKNILDASTNDHVYPLAFTPTPRRTMMTQMASALAIFIPTAALAAVSPMEEKGGIYATTRVEGAGAGVDVFTERPTVKDVLYLPSLEGVWQCEREVIHVDGDTEQAELTWISLGGTSLDAKKPRVTYLTRYINTTDGLILDRKFEVQSRQQEGTTVTWDSSLPDTLKYGSTELNVVQRKIEPPSEEGWGFDELVCITGSAGGIFGDTRVVKVARVKRRYRRAYTSSGDRIIEGLEIMKTFRVLDGIAGELPTSTTKSRIQMTRPKST